MTSTRDEAPPSDGETPAPAPAPTDVAILSFSEAFYTTRRLLEAARARGCSARVIDPLRCVVHAGPDGPGLSDDGVPVPVPDVVLPRLGAKLTEWGLSMLEALCQAGARSPVTAEAIRRGADKLVTQQLLDAAGLPTLPMVAVRELWHLDDALAAVGGAPVVLKLRRGTQGQQVMLAPDGAAARSALGTLVSLGHTVLVQPFVPMDEPHDIRVLVCGSEPVVALARYARSGDFRSNVHQGGRAVARPLDDTVSQLARHAAAAVGLPSCGVDLLPTRDGLVVLEVNGSPGIEGAERATGLDLADVMVASALERTA